MANKKALGRGLRALIPDIPAEQGEDSAAQGVQMIAVARIAPNPFQPREKFDPERLAELKQSIAEKGLVQPVTVRPYGNGYQLIAGERRLRAVSELGITQIPAYILTVETDEEMLELAIIENIHREDLNAIDVANGYKRLIEECKLTQEEVAVKVGKDRTSVTNFLRLLKLPRRIQESVQSNEISFGHARALLSLGSSEEQLALWKKIISGNLSVRKVEEMVREPEKVKSAPAKPVNPVQNYYLAELESRLRDRLATKVSVKNKSKGGTIEIEYYSSDELERIIALLLGE
ncbi:MAG TPA: ParB/RepB/Spo0J family partition protein [bacterium]|nr:ParB/RepB/Spo0J family partition protein [bacterium]HQG45974.1 ParB/RepB/Spo0J family partition protein [bacterium]HQI49246.1 ParB/RepB/Spo0J family partition protein [bacterium]HQJ63570.1 ParB/RepB/Spo0J family partition protein [bacterium]